jgi:hypothetical protein
MNPQVCKGDSNNALVVQSTNLKAAKKKSGKNSDKSASDESAESISLDASSF